MQRCKLHGKIPALVFLEMKPGWDARVSKLGACKLGGLHPLTALLMEKIHVILFSKYLQPNTIAPKREEISYANRKILWNGTIAPIS